MRNLCYTPAVAVIGAGLLFGLVGCATAPRMTERPMFLSQAQNTMDWFQENVPGLREQIRQSAGYTVFPNMLQYGTGFGGGKFGRGMVATSDGAQVGWSAINTGSLGLQAGIQDFKMLVVFQDEATFKRFKANRLSGAANGVAVLADVGGSRTAPFEDGVAVYQGANIGLLAGVNVGLDLIRFESLDEHTQVERTSQRRHADELREMETAAETSRWGPRLVCALARRWHLATALSHAKTDSSGVKRGVCGGFTGCSRRPVPLRYT